MRIAVYGGSFNPPHVAHAMVASWLLWTDAVDEVWLVPVFHHAFDGQQAKSLAAFEQRLAWCRALARDLDRDGDPRIRVSAVEQELPTPSFTIDTLRHLADRHPEHSFRLVVGADVLDQAACWRDWAGIEARFAPIVVGRAGFGPGRTPGVAFPAVSSTEIRAHLERGEPIGHLVTASVARLLSSVER